MPAVHAWKTRAASLMLTGTRKAGRGLPGMTAARAGVALLEYLRGRGPQVRGPRVVARTLGGQGRRDTAHELVCKRSNTTMPTQREGDKVGGFARVAVAGAIGLAALAYLSAV